MAEKQSGAPMTTAGITRYFEEYHSKIEIKPGIVIVFSIFVILVVVAMHVWGTAALGIA